MKSLDPIVEHLRCEILELKAQNKKLKEEMKLMMETNHELRIINKDKYLQDYNLDPFFITFSKELALIRNDVIFLNPSLSQILKSGSLYQVTEILTSLSYDQANYLFICLNNGTIINNTTGKPDIVGNSTHWSLLVHSKEEKSFFHIDSAKGVNLNAAKCVMQNIGWTSDAFVEVTTIQQNNDIECGLHVLANCKYIISHFLLNCSKSISLYKFLMKEEPKHPSNYKNSKYEKNDYFIGLNDKCLSNTKVGNAFNKDPNESEWQSVKRKLISKPTNILSTPTFTSHNKFSILKSCVRSNNSKAKKSIENSKKLNQRSEVIKTNPKGNKTDVNSIDVIKNKEITDQVGAKKHKHQSTLETQHKHFNGHREQDTNFHNNREENSKKENRIKSVGQFKIGILSDSHGRELNKLIRERIPYACISSDIKPNAKTINILANSLLNDSSHNLRNMSMKDYLIIIGGTNDIKHMKKDYEEVIDRVKVTLDTIKNTNIIISSIPYRYDLPHLNKVINIINKRLKILTDMYEYASFISLNGFNRSYYTGFGLHFNKKGKQKFVNLITENINSVIKVNTVNPIPVIITYSKRRFSKYNYLSFSKKTNEQSFLDKTARLQTYS
jgi:hypothetical protein